MKWNTIFVDHRQITLIVALCELHSGFDVDVVCSLTIRQRVRRAIVLASSANSNLKNAVQIIKLQKAYLNIRIIHQQIVVSDGELLVFGKF